MNWHKLFTAALIEEDGERLLSLLNSMPQFENIEQMQKALGLISQAIELFEKKKIEISHQMQKIEKEKKFMTSCSHSEFTHIDLHS